MAILSGAITRALVVGAVGLGLYTLTRRFQSDGALGLLDWRMVRSVAERVSGREGRLTEAEKARLLEEYGALVRAVERPLSQYLGNELPLADTVVEAMDRPGWIHANISNFRLLLEPVETAYARGLRQSAGSALAPVARVALSSQLGLLIGFLARRVLGQYDVSLLGKEPVTAGKLYFVQPNIRALERRLGVPPREVRQWIVLHEATHAHEFELHPWVRSYLNDHLREYLRTVVDDMQRGSEVGAMGTLVARLAQNLRQGHNLLNALMTPRQRALVSELQALMTLAEGYSNHVMNAVGRQMLPHFDEISRSLERRQKSRGQIEELFLRITGLKMKMEQYKIGEAFVDAVVEARGIAFLNRAWEGPELLPSEAELSHPQAWIARLERRAAA